MSNVLFIRLVERLILVVTLSILLSSDIGYLMTEKASILWEMMSLVVMWAPNFKIRFIFSWFIMTYTCSLVKLSKVKSNHQSFTILSSSIKFCGFIFCWIIVSTIHHELLGRAFWLRNNVLNKNELVRYSKFGPCLTLIPWVSNFFGRNCIWSSNDQASLIP